MKEKLLQRLTPGKLLLAVVGIIFVGTGVAFNAAAALGNDAVGIIYDGIRSTANLTPEQLGVASNMVNISLMVVVLLLNRHYINIGTFIYILPYGFVVDMGGRLYRSVVDTAMQTLPVQILGAAIGCSVLYLGVAMFITADIGLDPFTGMVMVINDKIKKQYSTTKIGFDIFCIALGTLLGGKLGVITVVTAFLAGPLIGWFASVMKRMMDKPEKERDNK